MMFYTFFDMSLLQIFYKSLKDNLKTTKKAYKNIFFLTVIIMEQLRQENAQKINFIFKGRRNPFRLRKEKKY